MRNRAGVVSARRAGQLSAARVLLIACLAFLGATFAASVDAHEGGLKTALYNAQPPAGGWDFPDEEDDVPTWADDLRAQALDLGLVSAFLVLAFVSFFRKSRALKYITLVVAVAWRCTTARSLSSTRPIT